MYNFRQRAFQTVENNAKARGENLWAVVSTLEEGRRLSGVNKEGSGRR